jgi:hypothetical protein
MIPLSACPPRHNTPSRFHAPTPRSECSSFQAPLYSDRAVACPVPRTEGFIYAPVSIASDAVRVHIQVVPIEQSGQRPVDTARPLRAITRACSVWSHAAPVLLLECPEKRQRGQLTVLFCSCVLYIIDPPLCAVDLQGHFEITVSLNFVAMNCKHSETMKTGVFRDVTPCGSCNNRRFGGA